MRRNPFRSPMAVLCLTLASMACLDTSKNENNNFFSILFPSSPGPGAPPSPGLPGCPAITRVALGFYPGSSPTIGVGETTRLSATPFAGAVALPDACSEAAGISWTGDGTVCRRVGEDAESFIPEVRALALGACTYSARVSNVTSPPLTVEVTK